MGIISFLLKVFFFYIIYTVISGLIRAFLTYKAIQKQASQHAGARPDFGGQQKRSYADDYSSPKGQTIDAEFEVINEKKL